MATFGFIGTGNMGGALARAARKRLSGGEILLANRSAAKAEALAQELDCRAVDNAAVAAEADYIFLGVKPYMVAGLMEKIDLRPQTELAAVCEPGGGVDVHRRRIHVVQEVLGLEVVLRDDGLGVLGAVGIDEIDGLIHAACRLDSQDVVIVLGVPVAVFCRYRPGAQDRSRFVPGCSNH